MVIPIHVGIKSPVYEGSGKGYSDELLLYLFALFLILKFTVVSDFISPLPFFDILKGQLNCRVVVTSIIMDSYEEIAGLLYEIA